MAVEWKQGGWTGSINRLVHRELLEHLENNETARGRRYSFSYRISRQFFRIGTFGKFLGAYFALAACFIAIEALGAIFWQDGLSLLTSFISMRNNLGEWMQSISSYFLGVQVGLLTVVSLSLALITLIAQRENSSTDVQVYYYESLSFELVASCLALTAVLSAQLVWPLHFIVIRLGLIPGLPFSKLALLAVHLTWLVINIGAVAYFIATTFRFVQQSSREVIRERYTVNVVLPEDFRKRLRNALYLTMASDLFGAEDEANESAYPLVSVGFELDEPWEVEVASTFTRPSTLFDVRVIWVRWALKRWGRRCVRAEDGRRSAGRRDLRPALWFALYLDAPTNGTIEWCRRRGGEPLTPIEKLALRYAFRFRRASR